MTTTGKFYKIIWLIAVCTCLLQSKYATASGISGQIDKTVGSIHDEFIYTLTIEGETSTEPRLPDVAGLSISRAGTSSQTTIVNGQISSQTSYEFVLLPSKAGTYVIPPITMEIDGLQHATQAVTFVVEGTANSPHDAAEAFIERLVPQGVLYAGQAFLVKTLIYTRVQLNQPRIHAEPLAGVQKIEVKGQKNYRKVVGQHQYEVFELAEILIASDPGVITLPIIQLEAIIPDPNPRSQNRRDPFGMFNGGRGVRRRYASQPAELTIRPLPTDGRPQEFSGLIGEFTMSSGVSTTVLKQGETATLSITVNGDGRTLGMKEPKLVFSDRIKVYADKPTDEETADATAGLRSQRTYKYALVANKPGSYDLGQSSLWYFDTRSGKYAELAQPLGRLEVQADSQYRESQDAGVSSSAAIKQDVKSLGEDLISLHRDIDVTETHGISSGDQGLYGGMPLLGFLMACISYGASRLSVNPEARERKRRSSKAMRKFKDAILAAQKASDGGSLNQAVRDLEQGFKTYVGDKLHVEGRALTTTDLTSRLLGIGLARSSVATINEILSAFDQINYGAGDLNANLLASWSVSLENIVREVEQRC